MTGILYLIPSTLGESDPSGSLPARVFETVKDLSEFIVEDERSARRFLKKINPDIHFESVILHPLNEHTKPEEYSGYLSSAESGKNVGLVSEAGCPCVADPGAQIVRIAHAKKISVVPLTGPSSIMLSLMASGFNGQQFTFHGYLPVEKELRAKKITELERTARSTGYTQIFIETPYRNNQMLSELRSRCMADTMLCIATDLTLDSEKIVSQKISEWKKLEYDFNKRPAVFIIGGR